MSLPLRTPVAHTPVPPPDRVRARRLARLTIGLWAAVVFAGLAAGCTPGLFATPTPRPSAPPAESCVARCGLQKSQCQARQETREQGCKENFARGQADYDLCRAARQSRKCLPPVTCLGADMRICDRQFEPCIADCGGPRNRPSAVADSDTTAPELVADAAAVAAGAGTAAPAGTVQTSLPRTTNADAAAAAAPGTTAPAPATSAPAAK